MKVKVLYLTLAGLYRAKTNSLSIEPHAAEEIEKAKRR